MLKKPAHYHRITLAAVVVTALMAGCGAEHPDALMASGKDYLAKNDSKAAVIQFKNALQMNPNLAEARFLLGALRTGLKQAHVFQRGCGLMREDLEDFDRLAFGAFVLLSVVSIQPTLSYKLNEQWLFGATVMALSGGPITAFGVSWPGEDSVASYTSEGSGGGTGWICVSNCTAPNAQRVYEYSPRGAFGNLPWTYDLSANVTWTLPVEDVDMNIRFAVYNLLNSAAALLGAGAIWDQLPTAMPVWLTAVVLGGTLGAAIGARHLPERALRLLLALLLFVSGLRMLV